MVTRGDRKSERDPGKENYLSLFARKLLNELYAAGLLTFPAFSSFPSKRFEQWLAC
jgi:hypothetical protein